MQTIERELADLIDESTALIDLYELEVVDFFIHDECRAMLDQRS
jgi:hypothetical protein